MVGRYLLFGEDASSPYEEYSFMFGRMGVFEDGDSLLYGYDRLLPLVCQLVMYVYVAGKPYIIALGSLRSRNRTPWSEKARERYVDSFIPLKSFGRRTV
jgi:hypothetical protein